jgi:Ca2+-binding EF-hand superfamily protein
LKLVFEIFDVNGDGFVSGEDIRGILSYIPLELIVWLFSLKDRTMSELPLMSSKSPLLRIT